MKSLNTETLSPTETMFLENDIALTDTLNRNENETIKSKNGFIVGFCLKGKRTFRLNNKLYHIMPNSMIICPSKVIVDSDLINTDLEWRFFIISSKVNDMLSALNASESWDVKQIVEQNPVWQLTEQCMRTFLLYYELIKIHLTELNTYHHKKERLRALLQAFIYDFHQTLLLLIPNIRYEPKQEHHLFPEFLRILSNTYPCKRKIYYYANLLNTTPKYLTYICKRQCGKTASDIINQHMIKDIITLLHDTRKSIKEISNELDFPNLSFFGTYVKHHLKMSPTAYRNKLLQEAEQITEKNDVVIF